jgi:tetrahydromethanopterin S-methyltransferase subunit F
MDNKKNILRVEKYVNSLRKKKNVIKKKKRKNFFYVEKIE